MSYGFRSLRPDREDGNAASAFHRADDDDAPPASPATERRQRPVKGEERQVAPEEARSQDLASFGDPDLAATVQRHTFTTNALRQLQDSASLQPMEPGDDPTRIPWPHAPYPDWPRWPDTGAPWGLPFPRPRRRQQPDMSLESVLFRVLTGTGGWDRFLGRFGALSRGAVSPLLRDILSDGTPPEPRMPEPQSEVPDSRSSPGKGAGQSGA